MATGEVDQIFHFQKTNLVKTASKEIDDMSVIRSAFGDVVIKLHH